MVMNYPGERSFMKFIDKRRTWHLIYAVCCLVYIGWMSYLSFNDFDRITREYRRTGEQVEPGHIRSTALEELRKECRKKYETQAHDITTAENGSRASLIEEGRPDRDCVSWPSAVVAAREAEIRERLGQRRGRAGWKLLLFSLFFVVIFLVIPPVVFYLFAALVVKLFKSVKIVRK